jgi:hypothetical protein
VLRVRAVCRKTLSTAPNLRWFLLIRLVFAVYWSYGTVLSQVCEGCCPEDLA